MRTRCRLPGVSGVEPFRCALLSEYRRHPALSGRIHRTMTDNFLPEYHPVVTHGAGDTIQCLVRDKAVRATPEERVRQRVLHWLIHDKGWRKEDLRLEKSYDWVSDPSRTEFGPNVELLVDRKVIVVVECNAGTFGSTSALTGRPSSTPSRPEPNGSGSPTAKITPSSRSRFALAAHRFAQAAECDLQGAERQTRLPRQRGWTPPPSLDIGRHSAIPSSKKEATTTDRRFVLAVHRVLFDVPKTLPYSHGGVHILEERGVGMAQLRATVAAEATSPGTRTSSRPPRDGLKRSRSPVNRWHRGGPQVVRRCQEAEQDPPCPATRHGPVRARRGREVLAHLPRRQNVTGARGRCHGGRQGGAGRAMDRLLQWRQGTALPGRPAGRWLRPTGPTPGICWRT